MKTFFKIALLILATALILGSCKKDSKNDNANSLIGTWTMESVAVKELTFDSSVSAEEQASVILFINLMLGQLNTQATGKMTYEFRESGEVVMNYEGEDPITGTYSTSGNILTITSEDIPMSGEYSISAPKLYWDISLSQLLEMEENQLAASGVKTAVVRMTLNKK